MHSPGKVAEFAHAVRVLATRPMRLPSRHQLVHGTEHYAHMCYTGLVFVEGHSYYAWAAGVLFAVAVAGMFLHEGME